MPQPAHPARTRTLLVHPIHALTGGTLRGAEAVVRASQPLMALAPWPGDTLEEDDEAEQLDDMKWLLNQACRAAAGWNDGRGPHCGVLSVCAALPALALGGTDLPGWVRAALDQAGLRPGILEVGLSEEAICGASAETLLILSALRDGGTGLALDRFAGSVDGLRALKRVPLTSLKLDRLLTSDLEHSRETRITLAAIIKFAHSQETRVVAHGVETPLQRDILADLGCDDAQGPLFGKSVPAGLFNGALLCLEPGWD